MPMTPELPIEGGALPIPPPPANHVGNPDRLPADASPSSTLSTTSFCSFRAALAGYLDMPVKATPVRHRSIPVPEAFSRRGAEDACLIMFDLVSTRGQAWVGLSATFVFHILDILLGAPPAPLRGARHGITRSNSTCCAILRQLGRTLVRPGQLADRHAMTSIGHRRRSSGADLDGAAIVLNCALLMQESTRLSRCRAGAGGSPGGTAIRTKGGCRSSRRNGRRHALLDVWTANVEVEAFLGGSRFDWAIWPRCRPVKFSAYATGRIAIWNAPSTAKRIFRANGSRWATVMGCR